MDEMCNYSIGVVWLSEGDEKPLNQAGDSRIKESLHNCSERLGISRGEMPDILIHLFEISWVTGDPNPTLDSSTHWH